MELNPRTAIEDILDLRLWDGKQVLENLRVSRQLSPVDLECGITTDKDDVAVVEPEVRLDQSVHRGR